EERRNRPHPCGGRVGARADWREGSRHERDDAEHRFAYGERRVAALEVPSAGLVDLNVEERDGELAIANGDIMNRAVDAILDERRPDAALLVHRDVEAVGRPVGKLAVVLVDARERRIHRTQPVVAFEEIVKASHASGRRTQRRSRNERSTALMTSWTHAPSPKSPSFAASPLRISPMKLLIRLA